MPLFSLRSLSCPVQAVDKLITLVCIDNGGLTDMQRAEAEAGIAGGNPDITQGRLSGEAPDVYLRSVSQALQRLQQLQSLQLAFGKDRGDDDADFMAVDPLIQPLVDKPDQPEADTLLSYAALQHLPTQLQEFKFNYCNACAIVTAVEPCPRTLRLCCS